MAAINLEQQRKRAKELLAAHRAGADDALVRIQRNLPRAGGLALAQIRGLALKLADAQLVVAREAGFATWPRMKHATAAAALEDAPEPLERAIRSGSAEAVRAALAARPPLWQAREALEVAVERDDAEGASLLLAYGAFPNSAGRRWGRGGGCLHAGLLLGRGVELLETLVRGGASVGARDRDGRTPLAIAVRTAQPRAVELLRRHGAEPTEVTAWDEQLGACIRGEPAGTSRDRGKPGSSGLPSTKAEVPGPRSEGSAEYDERRRPYAVRAPGAPGVRTRSDHQHLCWAIRAGHVAALPALLALGLDPAIPDDDGETALHLAVAAGSLPALDALLAGFDPPLPGEPANASSPLLHPAARGTSSSRDVLRPAARATSRSRDVVRVVDARNFRDETALTRAYREPDPDLRAALVDRLVRAGATRQRTADLAELFEDAADAVVAGDLARLTALLDREPALATAHSFRSHRATLLHYVAANGVEGVRQKSPPNAAAVAALLIARGADPNALAATYGGGPGQTPLLLTVTSAHPDEAGVMADVIATLVRGGAKVDGIDGDRSPITGARRSAARPLVAAGARVDLATAARLGLADQVRAFVRPDGTLADGAALAADRARPDRELLGRALLAACTEGHTEVAEILVDAGAPLDARNGEGMTPLHMAAWFGRLDTMRFLIARGAPLEAKNEYGGTVLDFMVWVVWNQWREQFDYPAVIALLIEAGADLSVVSGVPTGRESVDAVFRRLCPGLA